MFMRVKRMFFRLHFVTKIKGTWIEISLESLLPQSRIPNKSQVEKCDKCVTFLSPTGMGEFGKMKAKRQAEA